MSFSNNLVKNLTEENTDTILPISLEKEMRKSYLDYAMSVIVGRALPDARDGLKPVHRRVLTINEILECFSNFLVNV